MPRPLTTVLPKLWETIRYSYWAIPAVMTVGALGLAVGLLQVDRMEDGGVLSELGWLYAGGSDGAREVLSVVAGSMITVAGVVFSITIVALTLASSQFGPRVLRNFMQDRGSQFVLGTFIATFVYSLAVLRTIRGGDENFIPQLSVTASVVMAIGSVGVLIYYIHHVVLSIQGSQIVAKTGHELMASVDRTFPSEKDSDSGGKAARAFPDDFGGDMCEIASEHSGFLQAVDQGGLVEAAQKADVVVKLLSRPGDFVSPYRPALACWPASHCDDDLAERLRGALTVGTERSHTQDVLFGVDQLVEVAVRAMSPGINDPFTAVRCLNWLGAALSRCLDRRPAQSFREDDEGNLRLLLSPVTFEEMADAALEQIREYGSRSAVVVIALFEVVRDTGRHVRTEGERKVLLRHANQILQGSQTVLDQERDRERVHELHREALEVLGPNGALAAPPRRA